MIGLLTERANLSMLGCQIKAYIKETNLVDVKLSLSNSELSLITSLEDYVLKHLDTKITIHQLCTYFQLSPRKLQMGVKYLYGDSIGQYISNLRMSHAKHLFDTTDFNVSKICNEIGISSQSYFSKVFKKKYVILPSKYRG